MNQVVVFETKSFFDNRGYNSILFDKSIEDIISRKFEIVQVNQSFSMHKYTLRGLHYQVAPFEQSKICFCLYGSVFNVDVNLKSFEVFTAELKPGKAMYIPSGYAHGFLTLEANTLFQWYVDNHFNQDSTRVLKYDFCDINWPINDWNSVTIGERDKVN